MVLQLPLGLALQPAINFDTFIAGENGAVLATWCDFDEPQVWVWGARGVGKTHLLHAACQTLAAQGKPVAYLPLAEFEHLKPGLLDGLEHMALVCIDDVETIAGREEWERALFNFYNQARAKSVALRLAAACSPSAAHIALPDLRSRLLAGPVFQLKPLGDDDKLAALTRRARLRGLDLPEDVGRYLLVHHSRDLVALIDLLDGLDHFSLAAQRRLTIPLVREYLRGRSPSSAD